MELVDYHDTCHHGIYRISCADMDALVLHARRCCQICGLPEREAKRGRLVIDHDGRYGFTTVRGLLCDQCNSLMGRFDARKSNDKRCYEYAYNSWFVRVLAERREAQRERCGR